MWGDGLYFNVFFLLGLSQKPIPSQFKRIFKGFKRALNVFSSRCSQTLIFFLKQKRQPFELSFFVYKCWTYFFTIKNSERRF